MRLYANRRECEIILSCLYERMANLQLDELQEYNKLANRIVEVNFRQCKEDKSKYKREEQQ